MNQATEQFKKGLALSEAIAENWDGFSDELWQEGPRAEIFEFFCRFVGSGPQRVLDAGCGPGASTLRMGKKGYEVIGVDFSPKMIEAAKRRGVEAVVSDCVPLPFADGSFDTVFCCSALEWMAEPAKALQEMIRVLKPGGRLVAAILGPCVQAREEAYPRLFGEAVAQNMMMPWELHRMLGEMGVDVEDMFGTYPPNVLMEAVNLLPSWQMKSSVSFIWAFGAVKKTL